VNVIPVDTYPVDTYPVDTYPVDTYPVDKHGKTVDIILCLSDSSCGDNRITFQ
jgi:hypothetical protein